jgi:hypothetical protein
MIGTDLSVLAAELPPVDPDRSGMPGGEAIDTLMSWAMYLALTACVLAAIGAGAAIALGMLSQRPMWAERGKVALVCSVIGAVVVGSAVTLVNTGFALA